MKHKFFKKATAWVITAAMLAGNVMNAFAAETQESTGTSSAYVMEAEEGVQAGSITDVDQIHTSEDIIAESSTEESTSEEDTTGEGTGQESSTQEDTAEVSSVEKWASWTDWSNETLREYLIDALLWTDEEIDAYEKLVTEESKASMEAFADGLELEDWEEILGTEIDPENPEAAFEEFLSFIYAEANPGTGSWKTDDIGTYYVKEDGTKAIGWFEMTEDVWYYFDENGYRKTGWVKDAGRWYYFDDFGIMQSDTWAYLDGEIYHFTKSGAMQTGWYQEDGDWYYLKPSGAMAIGWQKVGASWYYLDFDGTMATGWEKVNGTWYYLSESGAMRTGWQKIGGVWYYLGGSGAMKTGWMNDGISWYYLSASGAMQTGWVEIGTDWFYFYSNGVMAVSTYIGDWYVDENGYYVAAYLTDAQILGKLEYLKTKYPNGKYWNHVGVSTTGDTSEIITSNPCIHTGNSYEYCNRYDIFNADIQGYSWIQAYQCAGFAFKLSDEIFGEDAERIYYDYNFDAIRIGDTIRVGEYFGSYGHSFVVIGKSKNYITVAECNASNTCKITWGRTISRSELNSEYKVTCETRRP
ncbi:MAG: N-acetylmuramoyl-L-alanine amidase family protein [Lachnospiraceae bacterium]|nr:N-acetylmuramoyl-L-alanine amidase family protein [Lachnospiraceae bacterium]